VAEPSGPFEPQTRLMHMAAGAAEWHGAVNPPVYHASTILFRTLDEFEAAEKSAYPHTNYGRNGTPTTRVLEAALAELEGADHALVLPSGQSAIVHALLAFLGSGDHLLMVDSVYGMTRYFCDKELRRLGIEVTYYDPSIGHDIAGLLRANTRVVYVESPGSLTFEMQDVRAIADAAHAAGAVVIADNTWATPLYFRPLDHGVDVSVYAATKHLGGHSDLLLGTLACREPYWKPLLRTFTALGACPGPDNCFLALRGLRTLALRLRQHHETSVKIATWLASHSAVERIIHPALTSDLGHALWQRDMPGAGSVFSVLLKPVERPALARMLEGMELIRMGFSWGGFESLMIPVHPERVRQQPAWTHAGPTLRIHAGLEHADDLIRDLERGLARLNS
jgi:cysteine-S-conjugate beta-lyase